ncbi:hypothetical protein L7F22_039250 [Adiantum nelumboides]|nr:hypothetical protein [Adiantum nelumboides]
MTTNLADWISSATATIFNVTFDRSSAESSQWKRVYLKELAEELKEENNGTLPSISGEIADRILIARLSLDPSETMTEDNDKNAVLTHLPKGQTSFDYLAGLGNGVGHNKVLFEKLYLLKIIQTLKQQLMILEA